MLEGLKSQIDKLIAAYESERETSRSLAVRIQEQEQELAALKSQIIEKDRQIDSLRLTAAFSGNSTQDSGAKEKVERLIREIDRCIALMEE